MALRRGFSALCLLLAAVALGVFLSGGLRSGQHPPTLSHKTQQNSEIPSRSLQFEYHSHSYLNPVLSPKAKPVPGLTIACQSRGQLHMTAAQGGDLLFIFEFSEILCGESNLMEERGLPRQQRYSREFLRSASAVQQALANPGLAVARSLFFHVDGGQRQVWSGETLQNKELRAEGEVTPQVVGVESGGVWNWQKTFAEAIPAQAPARGLQHTLQYEVKGSSQPAHPVELGLLNLEGQEQTISLQKKQLLARTDIQIRMHRIASLDAASLQTLLAETEASDNQGKLRSLNTEEKQRLIKDWQSFRDQDGLKSAHGESAANQGIYLELKQALRRDPSLAQDLAADLQGMDPTSSGFATLAGALIYSGEAQALDAFIAQAEGRRRDAAFQSRALPMIGLAPVPDAVSWKYLDDARHQQTSPELTAAAELGLATHLKKGYQDQGATEFTEEIWQRMNAATSETDRLYLLDVVGNTGLVRFLPLLETWLNQGSLVLRQRIAQALRHIPGSRAETLLLQLAADAHAELSLAALQSLRERTLAVSSLSYLLGLLRQRTEDRLRLVILENLYSARALDSTLLQKIQKIRESLTLSPGLNQAWNQIEEDWQDHTDA